MIENGPIDFTIHCSMPLVGGFLVFFPISVLANLESVDGVITDGEFGDGVLSV